MRSFLTQWLILTVAAAVMVVLLPGMTTVGEPPILGVAAFSLFMALINASVKPLMHLVSLPITVLTFGIFYLVVNWLCMRLASWLALSLFGVGVYVHGFLWATIGSIIMAIVSGIVGAIVGE